MPTQPAAARNFTFREGFTRGFLLYSLGGVEGEALHDTSFLFLFWRRSRQKRKRKGCSWGPQAPTPPANCKVHTNLVLQSSFRFAALQAAKMKAILILIPLC